MKRFMKRNLKRLDYLYHPWEDRSMHDIIYAMEMKQYPAETIIQRPGDPINELIYLYEGEVEIFTLMEDD